MEFQTQTCCPDLNCALHFAVNTAIRPFTLVFYWLQSMQFLTYSLLPTDCPMSLLIFRLQKRQRGTAQHLRWGGTRCLLKQTWLKTVPCHYSCASSTQVTTNVGYTVAFHYHWLIALFLSIFTCFQFNRATYMTTHSVHTLLLEILLAHTCNWLLLLISPTAYLLLR